MPMVVVLMLHLLAGGEAAARQGAEPPALLRQALGTLPGISLPARGASTIWLVQDFDRDMKPDVAAVVMNATQGPPARAEYGVLAVHASAPDQVHWVVPLDVDVIHGIAQGRAPDTIVPLFCADCEEGNIWLRWSGDEYEAGLHAVGEDIEIGGETQADIPLYASPNLASTPTATVPHCTTAVVQKVGGQPDARWYYVETSDGARGWVNDRVTTSDICVG